MYDYSGIKIAFSFSITFIYGRDSSVHILIGYRLDGQGSFPGRDNRIFSSPQRPHWLWVPASLLIYGYPWGWPEHESDHSLPTTAKVKNSGVIPPLPHISPW
jgi:hypothetical protein